MAKTTANASSLWPGKCRLGGGGGGGQMFANFKKVGHAAETLALIRKFDQISTYNSFILLVMVGHSQLSFCNTLFFLRTTRASKLVKS